jgi:hypothetical protein
MTDAPNGWPDPSKPGVPLHPERDGWHWLARNADDAWPFYWVSGTESGWCAEDGCNVDCADTEPEFMAHYWPRYLGPCLTPAEHAAALAAQAMAMWEACVAWHAEQAGYCGMRAQERLREGQDGAAGTLRLMCAAHENAAAAIRALPLPDASALAAMLAEARREGMREAAAMLEQMRLDHNTAMVGHWHTPDTALAYSAGAAAILAAAKEDKA